MANAHTTFKDRGDGYCERCGRVIGWHAGTSCYSADATGMPAPAGAEHAVRTIVASRSSSRGGRRTTFAAWCTCGAGTTNSANAESARRKIALHAAGDDRGMVADLTPSDVSTNVPRTLEGTTSTEHLAAIATAAQALAHARDGLEQAIVAARRDKVSLRAIADAAGLSHEHVRRLTTTERGAS